MQKIIEVRQNFLARLCFIVMFIVVFFCCTTTAYAGTLAYIQSSVDLNNWEVLTSVIRENVGLTAHSPEVRRVDSSTLSSLSSNSSSISNSINALSGLSSYASEYDNSENYDGIKVNGNAFGGLVGVGEKNRVLTFPGKGGKSETADYNRAVAVNDALIYDLNQAFSLWLDANGYTKTPKLQDFHSRMIEFLNSIHVSGDYCTVSGVDGEFRWRIAKGYTSTEHDTTLRNISDDADYVNWGMLVFEAFNNYLLEGDEAVTDQTVYSANPGQLEKVLVSLCRSALDGLTSILGLWTIDDLMFNTGIREAGYVGGIFPNSWESVIWTLFVIAEVLAAMILMFGIINRIMQRAMTTMNTFARLRAMQQIQDIIVCAIALALLPLILRIIISMSKDFTGMIYTLVPINPSSGEQYRIAQMVSRYSSGSGTIAGCIAQFMFFGVQVYFNFFYMLRSLMVAFLIIIAPIMVSMVMVSDAKKQMSVMWAKELLANVLIQPIHAFIMATILLLPNSSHGFDNIIALYALIPLTTALRTMFFGGAGGFMDRAAETAKGKLTGSLSRAATVGGAAGLGFVGSKVGQALEERKEGKSKGEQSQTDTGAGDLSRGSSNTTSNNNTAAGTGGVDNGSLGVNPLDENSGGGIGAITGGASVASGSVLGRASRGVAGLAKGVVLGASSKAAGFASGVAAGANNVMNDIKTPGKMAELAKGTARGVGQKVKSVGLDTVVGAGGVALATLGGALSGAGIQGGQSVAALGMNMATYRSNKDKKDGKKDDKNDGKSSSNQQKTETLGRAERLGLSEITDTPNSIELGSANSGFENMGEVLTESTGTVNQKYSANKEALETMGISDLQDHGDSITFTADPSKSPETAELGAYSDYCQYLEQNGQGDARSSLQRATGISATKTDEGLKVNINKKRWRAARNNGDTKYYPEQTNIYTHKNSTTKMPDGLYINGPRGVSQSLLGGIQSNVQTNTSGSEGASNTNINNTVSHIASFAEVIKAPETYNPIHYKAEPDMSHKVSNNPQTDTFNKNPQQLPESLVNNQQNNSNLNNNQRNQDNLDNHNNNENQNNQNNEFQPQPLIPDVTQGINRDDIETSNDNEPSFGDDFDNDMLNFENELSGF